MNLRTPPAARPQAGYTLLTTLILTGCITAMLAATLSRTMTSAKLDDRNNAWQSANAAAEAATEKVLSRMMVDFANGGETSLSNNLTTYRTGMLPTTNESTFWTNFLFSDGNGNNNATYVARTTTAANPPYVMLEQQYPGLSAFAATYRVLSNAQYTNNNYDITGSVQQDIQMAEIPVFQFAIFYNTLLEFSDCATMTVNGRVHCNTNINVGCTSSATLTFNYFVDCTGYITNPGAMGVSQSSWVASHITYSGTPSPGYGTGEPVLTLPVGTNSTDPNSVRQIIYPPPAGESQTNPISSQRYYNKADMIITVTNAYVPSGTNMVLLNNTNSVLLTNAVFITIKSTMYDSSPSAYAVTNGMTGNITNGGIVYNYTGESNAWVANGFTNWLSLTNTFFDQRQNAYQHVVQIDVSNLSKWIGNGTGNITNSLLTGKWGVSTPFNGNIYIQDYRTTNANWQNCVRLVNGQNITNGLYTYGLTVATQNPLYIMGLYNCPGTNNVSATNTIGCRPCSVVCDALTILSPAWQSGGYDALLKCGPSSVFSVSRPASANDTVNVAIMTGNVLTTGTSATEFSGGVHNLTRLLEDWSSSALWLNSSIICLYTSVQANQQFQAPGTGGYYNPPTRHFSFDLNFQNSTGLPPGTPLIDRMIRADWGIAPPNDITYTNPTMSFVPH
jgi:hypothetical protein